MKFNIGVLKGDGIGPEIVEVATEVLNKIGEKYNHEFDLEYFLIGGSAIDAIGVPLPQETLDGCRNKDSILLGAVGGSKWDNMPKGKRPENALLDIREKLNLYCNFRPAKVYKELIEASPIKNSIIKSGVDMIIVRELTGGIYFGEKRSDYIGGVVTSSDLEIYSDEEIRRISIKAFELARKRRGKLTSIDKANVLESSKLWRKIVNQVSKDYEDVELEHLYVDNASMQLIKNPASFDVILCNNIFGDILSDEAAMITGSIGMLPSASLGDGNFGMYEPIHGSAPDIAGKGVANPIATILSVGMMLKNSFNLYEESEAIEEAVNKALEDGYRTLDILEEGMTLVGTKEMGDIIIGNLGR